MTINQTFRFFIIKIAYVMLTALLRKLSEESRTKIWLRQFTKYLWEQLLDFSAVKKMRHWRGDGQTLKRIGTE